MKICTLCQSPFKVLLDEISFLKKMDFKFGNTTVSMPEPTQCPDCRNQIRTAHRNERYFYHRKSDFSGKQFISIYSPKAPWGEDYKVYSQEEWESDQWDGLDYGRDFDFSRPFFEQFAELSKAVPYRGLITVANDNSPYTTGTGYCKNCHLINSSEYCEDCYYGKLFQNCTNCVDGHYLYDSELCYECFSCRKCYSCVHVSYSQNCSDCWFSENLIGCRNCFLSTNLSNKEYHFMNQPLPKAEYEKRIKEFKGSYRNFEKAKEILAKLRQERIHKYATITNSENCTGDFIENSRNCRDSYDVNDSEDCRYVWLSVKGKDSYDSSNIYINPELHYQVMGTLEAHHIAFSIYCFHSQNILYSQQIYNSKDLFGCMGLRRKQYCVFNRQYKREEYEALVPKIIDHMRQTGEWGQFFPPRYAAHGYNESLASEYYPLKPQEVKANGWNWKRDDSEAAYQGPNVEVPDNIRDVPDDITERILSSEKLYKVIPQELRFYRQLGLPIPRKSPDERYDERLYLRNPRKLYDRTCAKCQQSLKSTFSLERPETIYCEKCTLAAVY